MGAVGRDQSGSVSAAAPAKYSRMRAEACGGGRTGKKNIPASFIYFFFSLSVLSLSSAHSHPLVPRFWSQRLKKKRESSGIAKITEGRNKSERERLRSVR